MRRFVYFSSCLERGIKKKSPESLRRTDLRLSDSTLGFHFIVVVVCFSFIIGNLLISYVNVRAIGKECTLTGKELLPGIFVAFVSPKLKYLIS